MDSKAGLRRSRDPSPGFSAHMTPASCTAAGHTLQCLTAMWCGGSNWVRAFQACAVAPLRDLPLLLPSKVEIPKLIFSLPVQGKKGRNYLASLWESTFSWTDRKYPPILPKAVSPPLDQPNTPRWRVVLPGSENPVLKQPWNGNFRESTNSPSD